MVGEAVCGEEECKNKCKGACTRPLDCEHLCGGVRGETVCLPCLEVSGSAGTGGRGGTGGRMAFLPGSRKDMRQKAIYARW